MIEAEPWSYHVDGSPVYSLADVIAEAVRHHPGAIAFTEAGRLTLFAELDQRSSQVARALQRKDARPGEGVAYIGASREVLAILADAEPRVVVADPPAAPWSPTSAPDETALILYTSGTTGVPKGVERDEGSVCAAPVPYFHVAGLGMLLAANLNGGNLLLDLGLRAAGPSRSRCHRVVGSGSMCRWSCSILPNGTSTQSLTPESATMLHRDGYPGAGRQGWRGREALAEAGAQGVS